MNQNRRRGPLGPEETTGHRCLTPLIEEIPEPEATGGPGFEAVDMDHVATIHPDIEVFERLGGCIHHDQIAAITKDLYLDDLTLDQVRGIRRGRLGGVVASSTASDRGRHDETRREGPAKDHSHAGTVQVRWSGRG